MSPLLPGLAALACLLGVGVGVVLLRSVPAGADRASERELAGAEPRRSLLAVLRARIGARFGRLALSAMSAKRIAFIRHRLDAAGHPGGLTIEGYAGLKATSTLLFALLGVVFLLLTANPILILPLAALGWLQVDLALAGQARRRQAAIDRDLPDFLDVLTVTVGAGLGFRTALGRVAEAMGGPLGQEVRTSLQQMGYGAARRAAFEGIRDRNDSENLAQFMTALLQAEELGAPLSETLADIAEDMRSAFGQRARRQAAKAVPRVSLIVTLLIVPGVIILLLTALYVSSDIDLGSLLG